MSITAKYVVHSPHESPLTKKAKVEGHEGEVHAILQGFEVELLSQDNMSGTIKLRFFGDNVAAAKANFVNDAVIDVTFTNPVADAEAAVAAAEAEKAAAEPKAA